MPLMAIFRVIQAVMIGAMEWLRGFINKNFVEPVILQSALPNSDANGNKAENEMAGSGGGRRNAISVRNAFKSYGKPGKKGSQQVLSDLNLTVQEGTIYTLLGSSGCGKTTLLSCIVGMTNLDNGACKIFGKKPGTKGCGIPGKKVGFMPQEIALYGEFTIREAMLYFGKINGMSDRQIMDRMTFLIRFLKLPPFNRPIRLLSGGQQRRVSFAVALLHEPQILILDEPTVGVDPILRKNIWKHLTELVETGKTTVVITTHYIEEANEAHRIGLMRNGRLLAEDSPENLLETFECSKLEEVFFKLSMKDRDNEEYTPADGSSNSSLRSIKASTTDDAENASANEDATTTSSLETCDASSEASSSTVAVVFNEKEKTATDPLKNKGDESTDNNNRDPASPQSPPLSPSSPQSPSSQQIPSPTSPVFNKSVEQLIDESEVAKNENNENSSNKQKTICNGKIGGNCNAAKKSKVAPSPSKTSPLRLGCCKSQKKDDEDDENDFDDGNCPKQIYKQSLEYTNRMGALIFKNFLCMWRNIGFVLFIFLLPAIQAILFCVAIGGEPSGLHMGVINYEISNSSDCEICPGCSLSNMSCNFIKMIPNDTIELITYHNESEALMAAKRGDIWGYLIIPSNFSDAMIQNGVDGGGKPGTNLYEDGFQGTHIKLHLDMTSQQIAYSIQRRLSMSFQKFTTKLLFDCGMNDTLDLPPTSFAEPIYGSTDSTFREFMAPGIILSIIFFMSVALTGSAFITERKEGMMRRTLVSGVSTGEIITAHLLTQYVIMFGQTMLVLAVMLWVFHIQIAGSTFAAVILTLVQGTCGMAFGFLISTLCTEERNAIQMALGSFYPNLLLSGVVWPLESIPMDFMRKVAMFLPQTMACEAMRSIFSRGWSFLHPKVWPGFAVSMTWAIFFWFVAIGIAKFQRN